ncbi:hypothetical protein AMK27_39170 [Streptomyces sp. CB02009]|nr:hypothetical protein AMK27_39170 [Streptomyces sp. CB02009]
MLRPRRIRRTAQSTSPYGETFGLHIIGALDETDETIVCRVLGGKVGHTLLDRARGIDPPHRHSPPRARSTSAIHAFDRDV